MESHLKVLVFQVRGACAGPIACRDLVKIYFWFAVNPRRSPCYEPYPSAFVAMRSSSRAPQPSAHDMVTDDGGSIEVRRLVLKKWPFDSFNAPCAGLWYAAYLLITPVSIQFHEIKFNLEVTTNGHRSNRLPFFMVRIPHALCETTCQQHLFRPSALLSHPKS